jgi:hypothetical protein
MYFLYKYNLTIKYMSQNRLPQVKDPLADITDLSIKPMAEIEETNRQMDEDEEILPPKEEVRPKDVFKKYQKQNIKLETIEETPDKLENNTDLDIPEDKLRGQRGKDKKKRKKKILTKSQLEGLAKGRAKSIETRKRNKEARKKKAVSHLDNTPKMEAPKSNTKLDYDTFSNYMDLYAEKRKKKHSNTKEPHPNKAIPSRMRPTPPTSKPRPIPRVAKWTGNASTFATHKTGGGRWNYGI